MTLSNSERQTIQVVDHVGSPVAEIFQWVFDANWIAMYGLKGPLVWGGRGKILTTNRVLVYMFYLKHLLI